MVIGSSAEDIALSDYLFRVGKMALRKRETITNERMHNLQR